MSNHDPKMQPDKTGLAAYQATSDARGFTVKDLTAKYTPAELMKARQLILCDMERMALSLSKINSAIVEKGIEHESA